MKKIAKLFYASAVVLVSAVSLQSCMSESPFFGDGEGNLRISAEVRGDISATVTRAAAQYDEQELKDKLVVYIENNKGVIRKYKGLDNVPEVVSLKTGSYVVEGWTGDSVSVSLDKKFYRGYTPVEIKEGENSMELKCNIANSLVSVDTKGLNNMLTDLKISVNHTRAKAVLGDLKGEEMSDDLEHNAYGSLEDKAYFMMPNGDNTLEYRIEGIQQTGDAFVKVGKIENVLRAHEYVLTLKADPTEITVGGALIRLEIIDIPVIEETVEVFPAPTFKATIANESFDLEGQVVSTPGNFSDVRVRVLAYEGLKSLTFSASDNFPNMSAISGKDIKGDAQAYTALSGLGVTANETVVNDAVAGAEGKSLEVSEYWLTFSKEFLDALPVSDKEYTVELTATDGRGFSNSTKVRFANSEAAVEHQAPVGPATLPDVNNQPMAILGTSATIPVNIYTEDASDYGVMYREKGTTEWMKIAANPSSAVSSMTRAGILRTVNVTITGLTPGKVYEYKTYADGYEDQAVQTFSTEGKYVIPNASMEEWSKFSENSNVTIPASGGIRTFWDSGNHGSSKMSVTLTDKSEDMAHSGSYSAKLRSQFVGITATIGKFAAGNMFAGIYAGTDGTDGILNFGQEYNGSHPSALSVWVNYRPGVVEKGGANSGYLKQGDTDLGQIYVALTTAPVEIRTKSGENQKLFDPNASDVIAYGEYTFAEAFGEDGQLKKLEIPIMYYERAKTNAPLYLVIVCSASKYGDYFCGGEGSTFYLDDFELLYDEIQWK